MLKAKQATKDGKKQPSVDKMLQCAASKRQEFSREDVMKAVAEFIVCDNQVSCCNETGLRGHLLISLEESCSG